MLALYRMIGSNFQGLFRYRSATFFKAGDSVAAGVGTPTPDLQTLARLTSLRQLSN